MCLIMYQWYGLLLAEGPIQPLSGMWRTLWPVVECSVGRPADGEPIGAIFVEVMLSQVNHHYHHDNH